jgi:Lar family restriction alleviation protein
MNTHRFTLEVKTAGDAKAAEIAVLAAFAKRQPDGCEFHLSPIEPPAPALLPCPCCGYDDMKIERNPAPKSGGPELFAIECGGCGLVMPSRLSAQEAANAWNLRHQ